MTIRLVVFDVDGTLTVHNSSWWKLHEVFGTHDKGDQYYRDFFAGKISYREWAALDAKLWRGRLLSEVEKIADETEVMPGAIEAVQELKRRGVKVAILSGGIDILANRIAEKVGIDYVLVNRILHNDGIITGEVDVLVGWGGKAKEIEEVASHFGIDLSETAFVGDGKNDMSVFPVVGLSIAFNPETQEVADAASITICKNDLTEILPFIFDK